MKKLFILIAAIIGTAFTASASCTASFTTSISGLNVTFTNTSTAPSHTGPMRTITYWNFGDGTPSSSAWSPSHTYSSSGTYSVTFYIEWIDTVTSAYVCDDSVVSSVTVSGGTGISGTVYRDTTHYVFDSLMVWLITYDSATHIISAVDSQRIAAYTCSSPYSFTGVTPGDYLIKAASYFGTTSTSGFVPTYHDSSISWSTAHYATVTSSTMTTGVDIWMQYGAVSSGPGFISGDVRYGAGKTTYSVGDPVVGLTVYLLNTSNRLVSKAFTDATGKYTFNVPYGTYIVSPEKAGLKTTNSSAITVSATSNGTVNFSENSIKIVPVTSAVPTVVSTSNIAIYPNPAHGSVSIQWNNTTAKNANISIVNVAGQQVLNTTVSISSPVSNLSIAQLQPGVYFMNITAGTSNYSNQLTIK